MDVSIQLRALEELVPHEEFSERHVEEVISWLLRDGFQMRPIAVTSLERFGKRGYLILDGHHRTESLRRLGYKRIVVSVIDLFDAKVKVLRWADDKELDKKSVIEAGLNGKKLPVKTTKHVIEIHGRLLPFQDNDHVEPLVKVPLSELK